MIWRQLSPLAESDPVLAELAAALDEPALIELLDHAEARGEYPEEAIESLSRRGLLELMAEGDGPSRVTVWHQSTLHALLARRSGSLAITLGVNNLAMLPLHAGAEPAQLSEIFARIRAGERCALLLTELDHGSNLLANQARAEAGRRAPDGGFVAIAEGEPVELYRLFGEKQLINGGTRHAHLITLLRTRPARDDAASASGDFSIFWVKRADHPREVSALPRWLTLPAQAADIAGVRFEGAQVDASQRIGGAGAGFALLQQALAISRGGVSSLAVGASARAVELAQAHARERALYGAPILQLDAIADHLLRQEALELLLTALSLKAIAAINLHGPAAIHYASSAKLICCALAEEAVTEGRQVLGARALLRALPYERLVRDVTLYGVFDGTSHVVLEQLHWRLAQLAQRQADGADTLEAMREVYRTPPQRLAEVARKRARPFLLSPEPHARALGGVAQGALTETVAELVSNLLSLTRELRSNGIWDRDGGVRFDAGELLGGVEALLATVELVDGGAREALGLPPVAGLEARLGYALAWYGARIAARLREQWLRNGLTEGAQRLDPTQQRLWAELARYRVNRRAELRATQPPISPLR
jgi:alkylation response protein AidB-like acyl-CoA dehydrogenase